MPTPRRLYEGIHALTCRLYRRLRYIHDTNAGDAENADDAEDIQALLERLDDFKDEVEARLDVTDCYEEVSLAVCCEVSWEVTDFEQTTVATTVLHAEDIIDACQKVWAAVPRARIVKVTFDLATTVGEPA